jgi:hypothetical protein
MVVEALLMNINLRLRLFFAYFYLAGGVVTVAVPTFEARFWTPVPAPAAPPAALWIVCINCVYLLMVLEGSLMNLRCLLLSLSLLSS